MKTKLILLALIVLAIIVFFILGGPEQLTLANLQAQQARLQATYSDHPLWFIGGYFLAYVLVAALSLPGASIMTLLGGALFGLLTGAAIISFASSIGATLAFWSSRYILRDTIEAKFAKQLGKIQQGVAVDGAFYLFSMRLVPLFPFWVVNLVFGVTRLPAWQFYLVSQLAMFPATLVYVNAGTQLAQLEKLSDILSPSLILSFALLGLFPLIARFVLRLLKRPPVN